MLECIGIRADTAGGGADAIERLRATAYDVVMLDLKMPGLDGIRVARRLRGQAGDDRWATPPTVPVLAVTVNTSARDRAEAVESGFDELLAKPVRFETLSDLLRRIEGKA